jgi:hypothetical protein
MGSIRAKFEALTGMFLTSKKETTSSYYSWMTDAKSEQEKENQFVCCCILKWEWSDFMMNTHAGMEKHLMMLNYLWHKTIMWEELDY